SPSEELRPRPKCIDGLIAVSSPGAAVFLRVSRRAAVFGPGLRGGPGYGVQRELDDLAAAHLLAFSGVQAEFGASEVLVKQCRRPAETVGVGAEGRRAAAS